MFFRYLFAYLTARQNAKTVARVRTDRWTKHADLPTTFSSDKWSAFVTQVIKEIADFHGFNIKSATNKPEQTLRMLE